MRDVAIATKLADIYEKEWGDPLQKHSFSQGSPHPSIAHQVRSFIDAIVIATRRRRKS